LKRWLIPVIVLLCLLAALLVRRVQDRREESASRAAFPRVVEKIRPPVVPPAATPSAPVILPVATVAMRLNAPGLTAADDISTLEVLLGEYRRNLGGNPVGDNEEIAAALLGSNPKRIACLPADTGAFLDNGGRLIDRWGTPYFFHALSGKEMQILSAGPDRELHTADDLHGTH
jgi:hypothetical protein